MSRKVAAVLFSCLMVFIAVVIIVDIAEPVRGATTIYVDDSGGANYLTIQEGIDAAIDGDTVFVYSGTYNEDVDVNKCIHLMGEDQSTTIINGTGNEWAIIVREDYTNITGFTITGSGADASGLRLESVMNCRVYNNTMTGNNDGLFLWESSFNHIYGNNASSNSDQGIFLFASMENIVSDNYLYSNLGWGLLLGDLSQDNTATGNIAINNTVGVYLLTTTGNNVSANIFSYNTDYGILCAEASNNMISRNNASSNGGGGISLQMSSDVNTVIENDIYNNSDFGIIITMSSNNNVYHNNLLNNSYSASDTGINFWDNGYPSGGNYWSDYEGMDEQSGPDQTDPGSDGIGDDPYDIDIDTQDEYPLMEPYKNDKTPPQIISGPDVVSIGDTWAVIEWETDELSDSTVEYGETPGYGIVIVDSTLVTSHSINLTGLTPSTLYHFRVKSEDKSGNEVISGDFTFTTDSLTDAVHNLDKDTYYDTIQSAIDDADPGNTIVVSSGTYIENVEVDRTITLIGEDRDTTIIDGGGNGEVVNISADFVNLTGFSVTNSGSSEFPYYHAGIRLNSIQDCLIENNNLLLNNEHGICLVSSSMNTVTDNVVQQNNKYGIYLDSSTDNLISENEASSNYYNGIYLRNSHGNTIVDNVVFDNRHGIRLDFAHENLLEANYVSLNENGISISRSTGNIFNNNIMMDNGIEIWGDLIEFWNTHDIDTSNTVNGKPVYYWKNKTAGNIPSEAGQVILANCTDITAENLDLQDASVGILLGFSSNNTIDGNNASNNNDVGIRLEYSDWNLITNNIVSDNEWGMMVWYSTMNQISDNIASNNYYCGIYISHSSNNTIYHNKLFDNNFQGYDDNANENAWDMGYPLGGNFWGDYEGVDEYHGSNQNISGKDGIGDTNYTFSLDSVDRYPLMEWPLGDYLPPDIILNSPVNGSVFKPGIYINLSITDIDLDVANYRVNDGSQIPFSYPFDIDTSDWVDDNYIIEIYAEDKSNNAITLWYYFAVDTTSPLINMNYPENNSVIKKGVLLNFSILDPHLNQSLYKIDDESFNEFFSPFMINTSSWDEGDHLILINASDIAGNFNIATYNITIDSTPPVISLISPDNESFITTEIEINFTISDANLNNVTYSMNEGSMITLASPYRIDTRDWPEGMSQITLYVDDKAGNNIYKVFEFTKDTIFPEIVLNSPENNTLLMEDTTIDFEVQDENLDSVGYSINEGAHSNFAEPYDIDTLQWEEGFYTIIIRAEDLAGHLTEKMFVFQYDTLSPSISTCSITDGTSDVSTETKVTIEFSEPMDPDSVESALSIEPYTEYTCMWENDNTTMVLEFQDPLDYDTFYTISIGKKAEDQAARELESRFELQFTTEEEPKEDGDEFPLLYLILIVLGALAAVIIAAVMVVSKKKKGAKKEAAAQQLPPKTIQVTCPSCSNLLSVNDMGTTMNVSCPYCSTVLTVQSQQPQSQMAMPQYPTQVQTQPHYPTQPQASPQPTTLQISCPQCHFGFSVQKTGSPVQIQCPNCGVSGMLR